MTLVTALLVILLGSISIANGLDGNSTDQMTTVDPEEAEVLKYYKIFVTDRRNALRAYELASFVCCPLCYLFNLLSLVVFVRMWRQIRRPILLALMALCVADPLATIINADYLIWANSEWSPMQNTDAGCKTINWLATVAHDCSNALCFLIAIDRLIAIFFPHKVDRLANTFTTSVAIAGIFVVFAGLEGYRFVAFEHVAKWNANMCARTPEYLQLGRRMGLGVTEVFGYLINWFGMFVCYALIVIRLVIWKKDNKLAAYNSDFMLMVFSMSVFSLGCNLMHVINAIVLIKSGNNYINNYDLYTISNILLLVGHSFNFVFYALMGKKFRQTLLHCCNESDDFDLCKESTATKMI